MLSEVPAASGGGISEIRQQKDPISPHITLASPAATQQPQGRFGSVTHRYLYVGTHIHWMHVSVWFVCLCLQHVSVS